MAWYFAEGGKQAGPIDDAQLEQFVQSGRIQPETLVWREGMANWQPYNQVRPAGRTVSIPPVSSAGVASAATAVSQAVCAECGGVFDVQDTIAYGNARVCAKCKPVFIQKLAEGARVNTGEMVFAGFWTRFAAVFVDGIILGIVNGGIGFVAGVTFSSAARAPSAGFIVLQLVVTFINLCIGVTYETFMIGKFGATLGKMACKVKVVTAEGGQVSYLLALGRYFAKMLSALILMIGYLMAAFDDEKRALHDRICNTRVIVSR
jgi:uncharacterized RDD family membrane protein YckC